MGVLAQQASRALDAIGQSGRDYALNVLWLSSGLEPMGAWTDRFLSSNGIEFVFAFGTDSHIVVHLLGAVLSGTGVCGLLCSGDVDCGGPAFGVEEVGAVGVNGGIWNILGTLFCWTCLLEFFARTTNSDGTECGAALEERVLKCDESPNDSNTLVDVEINLL